MQDRTLPPILSAGTTVVLRLPLTPVGGGDKVPAGSVGTIVRSPLDATHTYRVKLVDGGEVTVKRDGKNYVAYRIVVERNTPAAPLAFTVTEDEVATSAPVLEVSALKAAPAGYADEEAGVDGKIRMGR